MDFNKREDFYDVYDAYKNYQRPTLKSKHVVWYDREFWNPAACSPSMSILEIGSGTGEFLEYLEFKGVERFSGVEQDARAVGVMKPGLAAHVNVSDVHNFLDSGADGGGFDRVAMLDVLEHFDNFEAVELLQKIKTVITDDGLLIVRVPNMSSPWGGMHQYGDLTHKAAYTPKSLSQLALAAGFEVIDFLEQRRGSRFRHFTEGCLHWILSKILTAHPDIWTANMIAIIRPAGRAG